MKVCTDSCLFGGWVANKLQNFKPAFILDIGTGTGLLALMLAQKFNYSYIHAIEIDEESAKEASRNFFDSKFRNNITLFNEDFNKFEPLIPYNLIICNPPFYNNQLTSPNQKKNLAMHSNDFSIRDLFKRSADIITEEGMIAILIPYNRSHEVIDIAKETGWFPSILSNVRQTIKHDYIRSMMIFHRRWQRFHIEDMPINEGTEYSEVFKMLLTDYYLYFHTS